ncbi:hypothetical protein LENED_005197 [Lentinula edodes]|uniref:F-box domain-containing protein n=1 Tax=Lentinula edodes TaxID=5353 RepID=A0A1Q3E8B8_LENED|nr:hypothetical protein LENED_005197 [Lentinula edodes]
MQAFRLQDLPVELERSIFEIAARLELKTAMNLSLVCRQLKEWIQPLIYEMNNDNLRLIRWRNNGARKMIDNGLTLLLLRPVPCSFILSKEPGLWYTPQSLSPERNIAGTVTRFPVKACISAVHFASVMQRYQFKPPWKPVLEYSET